MKQATLNTEFIDRIWSHVADCAGPFAVLDGRSKPSLSTQLLQSFAVFEAEWGIIRISNMVKGYSCVAHGIFWSPQVWRANSDIRQVARWLRDSYNIERIYCIVPHGVRSLRRLLTHFGFQLDFENFDYYKVPHRCIMADIYVMLLRGGEE